MKKWFGEFKKFIQRGNVVDLAVGVVIGVAFGAITKSLVDDIIMPPLGLATGGVDFKQLFWVIEPGKTPGPYTTMAQAKAAGAVTINYGNFVNTIINFLIISLAMFGVVKAYTRLSEKQDETKDEAPKEPVAKECPFCFEEIPIKATRCPKCTSHLDAQPAPDAQLD